MNEKYLQYCLYYKGEEDCTNKNNQDFFAFWSLENQYWHNTAEFRKSYEEKARKYIDEHPKLNNFLTSYAPLPQKAFVLYAEDMLSSWLPQAVDMVFDYGKTK